MADQKLSQLTSTDTALTGDILYIVGNTTQTSYQITFDNLQKSIHAITSVTITTLSATTVTATSLASLNISTTNLTGGTATLTTVTATNLNGLTLNATTVTASVVACTYLTAVNSGFEPAIATGTASEFWRGDKVFAVPAGGGDVSHSGSSTAGNIVFFVDTTGTLVTDNNNTVGILRATSITATSLGSLNISTTNLTFGTITGTTVTATSLASLNVSTTNLTFGTITGTTVTATSLASLNISTTNLQATSVTATSLGSLNISTTNLTGGTLTVTTVTATSLASLNISTTNLQSNSITSSAIGSLNLSVTNLQASYITASYLNNATISNLLLQGVSFVMDGGGSVLGTGQAKGYLLIPYNATMTNIYLMADVTGNVNIDIWKSQYSLNNLPTAGNSIFGATPAAISLSNAQSTSLSSGYTGSVAANDVLAFNIDSASTLTNCTVSIVMQKL